MSKKLYILAGANGSVKNGGHFVPDDDVRRRYLRSKENFVNIYAPVVDHWMLYYNGRITDVCPE